MSSHNLQIGMEQVWAREQPMLLSGSDRKRHLYIIGQTGTGKSTLFKNIFSQDVSADAGVALIDPHGDLANEVLDSIPRHRVDDVIILDPSDNGHPVACNPFYRVPKDDRALVAANTVASFHHAYPQSWGPQLQHIFYNAVRALLDAPDHLRPSYLSIPLLLVDEKYRAAVAKHVHDSETRRFFQTEYNQWSNRERVESIKSTQNKLGQFLANPFIRNILGQWKPTIDFHKVLEESKILIVRLPKGLLGEEATKLFGSAIVSSFQHAAMKRASIPEHKRNDFHLLIDEFQNFATTSFESILSESRKYSLTLCCGHQYIDQLSPEISAAIFGNVGSVVSFRVGARDAQKLSMELGDYSSQTLRDLSRGEICARLMRNGDNVTASLGRTVIADSVENGHANNIRKQSQQRYGSMRNEVEGRISSWVSRWLDRT